MKRLLLLVFTVACAFFAQAQLLTWTPAFPKETAPITITVDATKGNQGLLGFSGDVYVHVGAITNLSSGPSPWLHVPFTWGSTETAAKALPAGTNKWSYTINNPRTFFNLAPGEELKYIAILFREGNCSSNCKAQRNVDNSDMFIPVYSSTEFAVRFTSPAREPKFVPVPDMQTWSVGTNFTVSANASQASTLKLYHNGTVIATANGDTTVSGSSTVATAGNQQLVAEATAGGVTKYDTLNIFVNGTATVATLPAGVRDGINYWPGTDSVTLVLRAPGKNLVTVIGDFNNWTQDAQYAMKKTPDGKFFWTTVKGLTAGTEYAFQYVVDGTLRIADPYSEKVLDPDQDKYISTTTYPSLKPYPTGKTTGIVGVLQPGQTAYNWTVNNFNRPDKRGLVIYEMLVRDFVAAHDWKTIQDSLSYFSRLGINAIEIMPFNEFEGNLSWGYNPNFCFTPDKYYGPANTLKRFIDSCHRRGIAVIMDIALNHQFGTSPMVQLYWDAANNRPAANSPWFNPVPKHAYNVGYDMNHESPDTKYYVGRVAEYWLQQFKIDGFRFDLAKGFTQKQTCDATGNNCDVGAWSAYDQSRIDIWKGYYDTVQNKSANAYVILEHFADNSEEKVLADYGMLLWGNLNYAYGQASMANSSGWDFSNGIYSVRGWTKPYLVTYAESHDEERIMYKNLTGGGAESGYNIKDTTTALKRAELTAAFLLTIPGPKMIWQFGELGYDYSINTCTDGTISNDCRLANKPIRWDYESNPRRQSLFNTYSKLINLRFHPWYAGAFQSGTVDRNLGNAFKWMKLTTANDTSDLVVIGNFGLSALSTSFTFPTAGTWYNLFDNSILNTTAAGETVTLLPGEYRVYVNRNVNNVTATPVNNVPWNGSTLAVNVYPNPVRSNYTIELALPQSGNTTILLYNSMGQYISTVYSGFLLRGERQLSMQRPALATGTYYLKLQVKETTKTIPITLQ